MLKRKNEEPEESKESTHYVKRVALDAEAVERKDIEDDKQKTSVSLNDDKSENEADNDIEVEIDSHTDAEIEHQTESGENEDNTNNSVEPNENIVESVDETADVVIPDKQPETQNSMYPDATPSSVPVKGDYVAPDNNTNNNNNNNNTSGPISSHRVQNDDPTYVHFRMLATISDTAAIVGKGGDSISKIKDESNARVNVSENLQGVPERIITVRGPAEYVAKAFGMIIRTINNEPFDQPSNMNSKSFNLRLLFPHSIMGYIIGKKGSRFREIEENSAAALKANEQILPASTDRILNINGVADAIHIATYYVAQTVIEHKQQLQKTVYYNPANYNQPVLPSFNGNGMNNRQYNNNNNNMNNNQSMMNPMLSMYPNQMKQNNSNNMMGVMNLMSQPLQQNPMAASNTRQGETITGPDGKLNQELYVPQNHIGLVIGRGGKNLKDIRQSTGCYVKVNDEIPGSSERRVTLIGNIYSIQNAIILINNKIESEKQRQQRDGN